MGASRALAEMNVRPGMGMPAVIMVMIMGMLRSRTLDPNLAVSTATNLTHWWFLPGSRPALADIR